MQIPMDYRNPNPENRVVQASLMPCRGSSSSRKPCRKRGFRRVEERHRTGRVRRGSPPLSTLWRRALRRDVVPFLGASLIATNRDCWRQGRRAPVPCTRQSTQPSKQAGLLGHTGTPAAVSMRSLPSANHSTLLYLDIKNPRPSSSRCLPLPHTFRVGNQPLGRQVVSACCGRGQCLLLGTAQLARNTVLIVPPS